MTLPLLAEALLSARCASDTLDLHLKDTLAAFLIGAHTEDGRALAHSWRSGVDRAERAAAAAGIARLSECDDIHLASCVTPGAVVIPVALAFAGSDAGRFSHAVSAGYASGLRLGRAVGGAKALAAGTWPTLLAAPLMAAVTASVSRGSTAEQLAHAMALALAGASGRRSSGPSSSRWLMFAESVLKGLRASDAGFRGSRGELSLLSRSWLANLAGHNDVDEGAFDLSIPALTISEVDFKPFPVARQAENAIFAFRRLLQNGLDPARIDTIEVFVPVIHVPLLTRPVSEDDRLSRLCNMGYQLAAAALAPGLLDDVARAPKPDAALMDFARRISVKPAADLDVHLPNHWAARVAVAAGRDRFEETVIGTLFDHDAPDLKHALGEKWRRLLPDENVLFLNSAATFEPNALWHMIEQRVSMLTEPSSRPPKAPG